jgi:hypothetical protein
MINAASRRISAKRLSAISRKAGASIPIQAIYSICHIPVIDTRLASYGTRQGAVLLCAPAFGI